MNTVTTITTIDDAGNLDIDVQSEITTEDQLVVVLLMVVENITGVSTDSYVALVDSSRDIDE